MNRAQIQGMRQVHNDASIIKRKMSAKEMALISHSLSKSGDIATDTDGNQWVWDSRFEHWALWH